MSLKLFLNNKGIFFSSHTEEIIIEMYCFFYSAFLSLHIEHCLPSLPGFDSLPPGDDTGLTMEQWRRMG